MKKILFICATLSIVIACEKKEPQKVEPVKIDSSKIYKDSAIAVINKADGFMKKGVKKELPKKEVNQKIEPLMKKYDYYLSKLSAADSVKVQEHRIRLINNLIDLQMNTK